MIHMNWYVYLYISSPTAGKWQLVWYEEYFIFICISYVYDVSRCNGTNIKYVWFLIHINPINEIWCHGYFEYLTKLR